MKKKLSAKVGTGYPVSVDRIPPRKQRSSLEALIIRNRINALLDLEQWAKLHKLDAPMILDGIQHMVISMLQIPDQQYQDHAERIAELEALKEKGSDNGN